MSSVDEGTGTGGNIRSFNFCSSSFTYLFQHVRTDISEHFGLFLDSAFDLEPNIHVIRE